MKILILEIGGYLGGAIENYLARRNYLIFRIDSLFRRKWVKKMQSTTVALKVVHVCKQLDMDVQITPIKNTRKKAGHHYYYPDNQNLKNLGYMPSTNFEEKMMKLIISIKSFKRRIIKYSEILVQSLNGEYYIYSFCASNSIRYLHIMPRIKN